MPRPPSRRSGPAPWHCWDHKANTLRPVLIYRSLELGALAVPPLPLVVDELVPTGSLTLFARREKAGKSLAVLVISVADREG